jgi:hypothetical protein
MEIRNNSFKGQPARNQADFTRPNREAIERGTPDVEDIRAQQARARAEHAARMEAAEAKENAQRIDAARSVHAERVASARVVEQRAGAASSQDVVDIAADVAQADDVERERMAGQALLAERAAAARLVSERAAGARDKLSLSETSLRLRADAQPADDAARAERVAELKSLYQQGRLNTDELVARAAYHMLSGE